MVATIRNRDGTTVEVDLAQYASGVQADIDKALVEAEGRPDLRDEPINWADIGCTRVVVGANQDGQWVAVATVEEASPDAWRLARWVEDAVSLLYPFEIEINTEW